MLEVGAVVGQGPRQCPRQVGSDRWFLVAVELDPGEARELDAMSRQMWAKLPPDYEWLREWEYV